MKSQRIQWSRRTALSVLATALLALAGCGKGEPPMGDVSGTITCEGAPVAEGRVSFMNSAAGTGGDGEVKNGTYRLSAPLPPGEYIITVLPNIVRQQEGGKGPQVDIEKPALDIPQKYRTTGTTNLKRPVTGGPNQINLDLKKR